MTTIDHRILIPAPPDVVWEYVSDITRNPDWQVDCTEVIFLTSRREGPGLRWRYATPGGHELVIAVTAWYNGLGYEYYFVDGTAFRENKGRIRLQEIPEGTIVQWTFTYELGGVLGGMRNSLGMKRQVDQTIAESLKTLWQKIKQSSGAARTLEPKSLMREAPDVEARSAYQPRHPSVVEGEKPLRSAATPTPMKIEPPIWDDDAQPIHIYDEPPVVEDDTRPRSPFAPPAAAKPAPAPEIDADFEPDFLDDLAEEGEPPFDSPFDLPFDDEPGDLETESDDDWQFEPPNDPSDTQPRTVEEALAAGSSELTEPLVEIKPASEETEPLPVDYAKDATETVDNEQTTAEIVELQTEAVLEAPDTAAAPETQDTGAVPGETASIWEIFGVPRPSETQELSKLEIDAAASEPEAAAPLEKAISADDTARAEPEIAAVIAAVVAEAVEAETEAEAAPEAAPIPEATAAPTSDTLELPPVPSRIGLRVSQRRKLVHLRRP
jgi:hypothetical protein